MSTYVAFGGRAPRKDDLLASFEPPSSPDLPPGRLQVWASVIANDGFDWRSREDSVEPSIEDHADRQEDDISDDLQDRAFTADASEESAWRPREEVEGTSQAQEPESIIPSQLASSSWLNPAFGGSSIPDSMQTIDRPFKRPRTPSPTIARTRSRSSQPQDGISQSPPPPPIPHASRPKIQPGSARTGSASSFQPLLFSDSEDLPGQGPSTQAPVDILVIPPTSPIDHPPNGAPPASGPSSERIQVPARTVRFSQEVGGDQSESEPSSEVSFIPKRKFPEVEEDQWLQESYDESRLESVEPESQANRRSSRLLGAPNESQPEVNRRSIRSRRSDGSNEDSATSSIITNIAEWHFRPQDLTPLSRIAKLPLRTTVSVLVFVISVGPVQECMVRSFAAAKRKGRGREPEKRVAQVGSLEVLDETGATTTVTMWDQAAEDIVGNVKKRDILYIGRPSLSLSHLLLSRSTAPSTDLNITAWGGKPQLSSTANTEAQICWRTDPDEGEGASRYRPDLRAEEMAAGKKVVALKRWAKKALGEG